MLLQSICKSRSIPCYEYTISRASGRQAVSAHRAAVRYKVVCSRVLCPKSKERKNSRYEDAFTEYLIVAQPWPFPGYLSTKQSQSQLTGCPRDISLRRSFGETLLKELQSQLAFNQISALFSHFVWSFFPFFSALQPVFCFQNKFISFFAKFAFLTALKNKKKIQQTSEGTEWTSRHKKKVHPMRALPHPASLPLLHLSLFLSRRAVFCSTVAKHPKNYQV